MNIVVSDTSPLRALSHLALLTVLPELFDSVLIPPAVLRELAVPVAGTPRFDLAACPFLSIVAPTPGPLLTELQRSLDPGEAEAITLAVERGLGGVLIDDAAGRAAAVRLGLTPFGVLSVLIRAKRQGLIGAAGPLLYRVEHEIHFRVSARVRA